MVLARRDSLTELQALPHPPPAGRPPTRSDVVRLASNENPYGASPRVVARLTSMLAEGALSLHRYPADDAGPLRYALSMRHGVELEQVMLGNGSTELLALLAHAALRGGGSAVFAPASFVYYGMATRMAGGECIEAASHTVETLLAAVRPDTRIVFLAQPGNPSGALLDRGSLLQLVDALPPDVLLAVDQAYAEYEDPARYPDAVPLLKRRERLVVLHTFSKIHGLAALRVGYALGSRSVIAALQRVRPPFNVSGLAQLAAEAALQDTEHLARSRALNEQARREFLADAKRRDLHARSLAGNFALLEGPLPGAALALALADRGVVVQPQSGALEANVRVTLGRPEELARFWASLDLLPR